MSNARLDALETRINRLKDTPDIAVIYPGSEGKYYLAYGGQRAVKEFGSIDQAIEQHRETGSAQTPIIVDV